MLEIRGLSVRYGQIQALDRLDMRVEEGEIISVIGANGAGKSTLLKAIAGLKLAMSGEIRFEGKPLVSKSYEMVRRGVALVPEGRRVLAIFRFMRIWSSEAICKRISECSRRSWTRYISCFPALRNAGARLPPHFPAVSSRCWPSAGR